MAKQSVEKGQSRSLFGPIVLIAIGVYFLLANLEILQSPNWGAVLQLWPLWLIFIGVNIIVQQAPRPLGGLLSGLVAITAVGVFGYVLMYSEDNALLQRLGVSARSDLAAQTEEFSYPAGDLAAASIEIDFSSAGADLYALEDSNELIAGVVSFTDELIWDVRESGGEATVFLDTRSTVNWTWFNPSSWNDVARLERWQIGLNPNVPLTLRLDSGSGSLNLALDKLSLRYLEIDSGSGSVAAVLPDGNYDVKADFGSGSSRYVLPANGRIEMDVKSGSGSVVFVLPEGMEARIEIDKGSGSFNPGSRFSLISGERNGDGVWETAAYETASNRINLILDSGSGSVSIDDR